MAARYQAPKGTFDVLPAEEAARALVAEHAGRLLDAAGHGRIETPALEETEVFARGVGASTDIVSKEMFSFTDRGGRGLTLRPEGTAPICRAYIEHGMHKDPQPVKLWYAGPFFRAESPQRGRYRQFNQIGAEVIGTDSPLADAELIVLLDELLRGLGIADLELRLGSLGSPEARAAYRDELRDYLREHEAELSDDVRARLDSNPMRAFDSDHEGTRAVIGAAPTMLERLEADDAEHFAAVRALLDAAGVPYRLDPTLVRGLDYYTRTIFSFVCDRLGAQSEIGGGGRYDGLIGQLGGPDTPAIGWAAGTERILLALDEEVAMPGMDLFIAVAEDRQRAKAVALAGELRHAGISVEIDLAGRSIKGQMKQADRVRAARTLILDEGDSARLRDMATGEERRVEPSEVLELIRPG